MDINTLRSISTLAAFFTFIGILWWAFSPRSSKGFEEAARLPFADDEARPGKL
jgi:cytochrome c oxidase cbb3-type subunit 4